MVSAAVNGAPPWRGSTERGERRDAERARGQQLDVSPARGLPLDAAVELVHRPGERRPAQEQGGRLVDVG